MRIVVIGGTGLAGRHAAEALAGVGHHVLLSILGGGRIAGNAHYAGRRRQEDLVRGAPVPWTIVRAAQFHEFAIQVVDWTLRSRIERPLAGRSGGKWPLPGATCRRRHRRSAGLAAEESAALGGGARR